MKVLKTKKERCVGCRLCLIECSLAHYGCFAEKYARLRLECKEELCKTTPFVCLNCKNARCISACPVEAIERVDGWVTIHPDKCIGCGACKEACPVGVIAEDDMGKAIKCDLCGGNPQCAAHCPNQALVVEEV